MGISRRQALDCFASDDLIGIGMEADAVRRALHPDGIVTYAVRGAITLAEAEAFGIERRVEAQVEAQIETQIAQTLDFGGAGVTLHGSLPLGRLADLISGIRQRHPGLWIQASSAADVLACEGPVQDTVQRLRDAGLDAIGEDVDDSESWVPVHRAAHRMGMRTSVATTFGAGETLDRRLDRLEAVRQLQIETGGIVSFVPRSFVPAHRELDGTTAVEALKTLAIARMYLDNVEHMQVSGSLKVLQMGLRFGGDDLGPVALEAYARVTSNSATEEELRRVVRDAGFRPIQRDSAFRMMLLG